MAGRQRNGLGWYESLFDAFLLLHASILKPDFHLNRDVENCVFKIDLQEWIIYILRMFTWVSFSCNALAISIRRARVKYLLKWNSFSSSVSCLLVKFVRPELLLLLLFMLLLLLFSNIAADEVALDGEPKCGAGLVKKLSLI